MSLRDRMRCRCADESMEQFAELVASHIHQPIVNATGLSEKSDFVISWSSAATQANTPPIPARVSACQSRSSRALNSNRRAL
jgi:uncharacterized protein (TIGR03435 family)